VEYIHQSNACHTHANGFCRSSVRDFAGYCDSYLYIAYFVYCHYNHSAQCIACTYFRYQGGMYRPYYNIELCTRRRCVDQFGARYGGRRRQYRYCNRYEHAHFYHGGYSNSFLYAFGLSCAGNSNS
jgi:hypothetical protein